LTAYVQGITGGHDIGRPRLCRPGPPQRAPTERYMRRRVARTRLTMTLTQQR